MLAKRYNVVQMRQFFSSKSCVRLLSLPMRGEWIEMVLGNLQGDILVSSLPMRGEWIEIGGERAKHTFRFRLSPCGESGLKCLHVGVDRVDATSLPMRGEWIEMVMPLASSSMDTSLPMRGEWIEMQTTGQAVLHHLVSPHAGRVD